MNAQNRDPKVTLAVYTLNEIDGMRAVMPKVRKEWCDEIIVIDGGSTDGTVEYAREQGYAVYRQKEPRWGGAHREAYSRAAGDIVIDFSPDGNSVPELIPQLVAKIKEGYDMVIASRYTGGAKSDDDTAVTGFGNSLFTFLVNLLFGCRYTDSLVIYRAFTRPFLEKAGVVNCSLPQCVTVLTCIRAAKIKARTADVPGDEPPRIGGHPKMNPLIDGLRVLAVIFKEFFIRDFKKSCVSQNIQA
ncbi:MAG TPA: glycosyltransferase family 2 protein [Verrucomicrobiae bacterium]|jgi:glycosyltransferase involved in cell wall biosynthesis|nr:glycosyltransferase family 2 protein [Verrucomicrobiae bacterium]